HQVRATAGDLAGMAALGVQCVSDDDHVDQAAELSFDAVQQRGNARPCSPPEPGRVKPSLAHAAVSRSFTQSAIAANVTAPASTAHTATASTLAKEYRTPRGSRGSGTAARTANSPGCSCSVTATGAAQVTRPCGSSTAI